MVTEELAIPGLGAGLLHRPDTSVRLRGGVVGLHGASHGERSQPLFDHLAETLVPLGYAVLSFDRRSSVNGSDVPLADQPAPETPPPGESWDDMDFEPSGDIARVTCPTLLIYGAEEECVPAPESEAVWRAVGKRDLTVVYLPGCGHFPVVEGCGRPEPDDPSDLSPDYTAALTAWFTSPRRTSLLETLRSEE